MSPAFEFQLSCNWRRTLVQKYFIPLPFSFGEGARRADEAT
jgi:hypothetical protein